MNLAVPWTRSSKSIILVKGRAAGLNAPESRVTISGDTPKSEFHESHVHQSLAWFLVARWRLPNLGRPFSVTCCLTSNFGLLAWLPARRLRDMSLSSPGDWRRGGLLTMASGSSASG